MNGSLDASGRRFDSVIAELKSRLADDANSYNCRQLMHHAKLVVKDEQSAELCLLIACGIEIAQPGCSISSTYARSYREEARSCPDYTPGLEAEYASFQLAILSLQAERKHDGKVRAKLNDAVNRSRSYLLCVLQATN